MGSVFDEAIPLHRVIRELKREIQASQASPSSKMFSLAAAEVAIEVSVSDSSSANGELGFWVFKAGAEKSANHGRSMTVTLNLVPKVGTSIELGDDSEGDVFQRVAPGDNGHDAHAG